jgi:hypothetical protein
MRPHSRWIGAATLLPAFLAACSDTPPTAVQQPPSAQVPVTQISDAVDAPGRTGFYFLAPMVPDPSPFTGTFDATLSPEVRVCRLVVVADGMACSGDAPLRSFTMTSSGDAVTVNTAKQSYNVNWATKNDALDLGKDKYRVQVIVADNVIGFADLWFVKTSKDLKTITGPYVGAVVGSPLNIAFRIETRVVGRVRINPDGAAITLPGTGTFTADARDLHDNLIANASFAWASTNPGIVTVSPTSGAGTTATAVSAGNAQITASIGGVTASADVVVRRKPNAEDDSYSLGADETLTSGDAVPSLFANDDVGFPAGKVTSITVGEDTFDVPLIDRAVLFAGGRLTVNADGSISIVKPTQAGQHTFKYTLANAAGSDEATVTVTVAAGVPATMTALSALDQTATAGTAVAEAPSVRLTDAFDNPVAGVSVTFAASPVGSVTGTPATTDANGVAKAGAWTLGTSTEGAAERVQTVTATAGPLSQVFTSRAVAGPAASVTLTPAQATIDGGATQDYGAIVKDQYGNQLYTRPLINWSSQNMSVATIVAPAQTQSPDGEVMAKGTAKAELIAVNGITAIRATVAASPTIFATSTLNVSSAAPVALNDQFTAATVCTNSIFGVCTATSTSLTGNVTVDNGSGPDYLGPESATASVSSFGGLSLGGTFAAGTLVPLPTPEGGFIRLDAAGTLTYTRSGSPTGSYSVTFRYELKNQVGSSEAVVTIQVP